MSGMSVSALSVRRYSTRGGTSAYTFLDTRSSASSAFSTSDSIFCDMSGNVAAQFVEPHHAVPVERYQHKHRPFVAYARQYVAYGQVGYNVSFSSFLIIKH